MTGRSSGSCTSQKMRQREAPRISAASIGSFGIAERPASMMMKENGVQFQISSKVTVSSAIVRIGEPCRLELAAGQAADHVVDRAALVQQHLRRVGDDDRHRQHRQDEDRRRRTPGRGTACTSGRRARSRARSSRWSSAVAKASERRIAQPKRWSVSTSRNRSRPTKSASHQGRDRRSIGGTRSRAAGTGPASAPARTARSAARGSTT